MTLARSSRLKACFAAAALATIIYAPTAHAETKQAETKPVATPQTEAAAVVDAYHAALHRNDTKAAAALLDDKVLIYEGGVAEQSKAEYAAHHLNADGAFSSKMNETIVRRTDGASGNFAWVATEGRTNGRYKDRDINLTTTETMVLRRANGTWKIVHVHWSSQAAPEF